MSDLLITGTILLGVGLLAFALYVLEVYSSRRRDLDSDTVAGRVRRLSRLSQVSNDAARDGRI